MVKVLICVWYNLPDLRNIGVGVDLFHLSRRLHIVVKIVYAPVSIRVYYMQYVCQYAWIMDLVFCTMIGLMSS